MKKFVLTALTISLLSFVSQAQKDTISSIPDEQITVNKEYDENGNLIRFDSTYVYQWNGTDTSINLNGGNMFSFGFDHMPDMHLLLNEFFNDSSNYSSPFNDPFFSTLFGIDHEFMDRWMEQFNGHSIMPDSIINSFQKQFKHHQFPDNFFDGFNQQSPTFKSKQQQEEWEKLKQKHEKELEEFYKKWENDKY